MTADSLQQHFVTLFFLHFAQKAHMNINIYTSQSTNEKYTKREKKSNYKETQKHPSYF
jgi:hypothetical protein